jgi:cytochrome c-type biogenesis protein CcsB
MEAQKMSKVMSRSEAAAPEFELSLPEKLIGLWPVIAPIVATVLLLVVRIQAGRPVGFLYGEALIMLALISFICAAVVLVTNIFVREGVLDRLGLILTSVGFCFNLTGWMIRWIEAGDKEGWKEGINGIWRYYPLDNLYALTLGFCAGAALATLVIIRKPKYRAIGALSMPILVVILALGMMMGSTINTLMPILDSYWRPIHVSIATIGYGVCLVSFGLAFAYLLKDGISSEAVAVTVILYGILVFLTVGTYERPILQAAVPFSGQYTVNTRFDHSGLPLRSELPMVGPLMIITLLVLAVALVMFIMGKFGKEEKNSRRGWMLFRTAAVLQIIVVAVLIIQVKTADNIGGHIPEREYPIFSKWMTEQINQPTSVADAKQWVQTNAGRMSVGMTSNPVDFGSLMGLMVALICVSLFAWRREDVMRALPDMKTIDSLLYKSVGVAFPLLTLLLITGAVWANESWGRYWGWDSKEVGALVAWMAYAGFLHTRISHGWRGRKSAYFALLGFALVIFTWLGVSFLLPGLHSYAQV